jgi:hypothetical protein
MASNNNWPRNIPITVISIENNFPHLFLMILLIFIRIHTIFLFSIFLDAASLANHKMRDCCNYDRMTLDADVVHVSLHNNFSGFSWFPK